MVFTTAEARQWTLRECIDYALQNNISLQKTRLTKLSAQEDIWQSQSALLPSLSASTGHSVSYQPWPESGRAQVQNGYVQQSVDKVFYNGSYGVSSNWTLWNGGRLKGNVELNELAALQAELDSATTANSIQEQIAQLYVQILYSAEAIKVSQKSLETSQKNEERGKAFVEVGKMSRADLAQLTSQRAQDEYQIVEAEGNLRNCCKSPTTTILTLSSPKPPTKWPCKPFPPSPKPMRWHSAAGLRFATPKWASKPAN